MRVVNFTTIVIRIEIFSIVIKIGIIEISVQDCCLVVEYVSITNNLLGPQNAYSGPEKICGV